MIIGLIFVGVTIVEMLFGVLVMREFGIRS